MDTQPFESMTTRDPAELRLIGVVSWCQFQPAFFNFGPIVYRLEHSVFIRKSGIRFPVGLPIL